MSQKNYYCFAHAYHLFCFLYWIGKSANLVYIFQMITPVTDFTHKINDRKEDIIGFKWHKL